MIFSPLVLILSWRPASKCFIRFLLAFLMADVSPKIPSISTIPVLNNFTTTSTMEPKLSNLIPGIYDYESSVNFDNYLKALGVNYVLRKLAGLAYPVVTIEPLCHNYDENVSIYVSYFILRCPCEIS